MHTGLDLVWPGMPPNPHHSSQSERPEKISMSANTTQISIFGMYTYAYDHMRPWKMSLR
jgi:hypothetical protein